MTYDCEKISVCDSDRILLVSLNRSFDQSKSEGVYVRKDLYDTTRRYWRGDIRKLNKVDYVLGVYKNIVRSVIRPHMWIPRNESHNGYKFPHTRYECEGEFITDSPFLNKDVSDFPFESGGAIAYIPKDRAKWKSQPQKH